MGPKNLPPPPQPSTSQTTVRLSRATRKFRFSGTLWSFATNKNCKCQCTLSLASSIQLTSLQPQTFRHLVQYYVPNAPKHFLFPKIQQQNLIRISCFPAYLVTFKPTTIKNYNTAVRLLIAGEVLKIDAHYVIVSILPPLTFP
jgi:hypothetical protein